jgi:hypothetical protein
MALLFECMQQCAQKCLTPPTLSETRCYKVSNDSRADWQFCQLAGADDVPTLGSTHERVLKDTSRGFYSL